MAWTILSFVSGVLTAVKMNQLYDNIVLCTQGLTAYAADSGSANAYAVTLASAPAAYTAGLAIRVKAANGNTGGSTLNVNSLGTKNIKRYDFSILVAGDIVAGRVLDLVYDGVDFILLNPANMVTVYRGYAMGGSASGPVWIAEIDGIQFSDEAAVNPTAALSSARGFSMGVNSATRGYALGGSGSQVCDGIQFSDESAITPFSNLPHGRDLGAGVNSSTRGYAMGSSSTSSEIDGIRFSDETGIDPGITLSLGRRGPAGVNSATRGYAMGGYQSSPGSTEIDGIQFSDESAINPSVALVTARYDCGGFNGSGKGYAVGGANGSPVPVAQTEVDGILFSNETSINPSAGLALARWGIAGCNSTTRGYAMGGSIAATTMYTEIDGILFSNDTQINPGAALNTARSVWAGVQSGGIL